MEIKNNISYEYIRGLAEGEGTFTFSPRKSNNSLVPSFAIRMHLRDKYLLTIVGKKLDLKNKIYEYYYPGKDGANRGPTATLIVREIGSIKNVIVPLFYKKLIGNKAILFENWMETIGNDPRITKSYKFICQLYKS